MALSNETVPPVVFLALSHLARNYTTNVSYTQAKLNHTPYPPKILDIYRRKVLHTRRGKKTIGSLEINYKTTYTNDEYKLRNRC